LARSAFHESELALLVETKAAREFLVRRTEDGERWQLLVRLHVQWKPVRSKRENPRTWASLDTLEKFTRSLGIVSFQVES